LSSELLLLDASDWTWIVIIPLVVIGGYFFLDRLMRKGIYEEGRMSGGMAGRAGNALSELQTLVAPAQRNVIEEQHERKRAEHDDAGDDPDLEK
jgi:hypothetical protein